MSKKFTRCDEKAVAAMPAVDWFIAERLPHTVRSPRYRCDRLVDLGILERRVVGRIPHLRTEFRKKPALWGAYHNGTLCCSGTWGEMANKIDNEQRGEHSRGWELRQIE